MKKIFAILFCILQLQIGAYCATKMTTDDVSGNKSSVNGNYKQAQIPYRMPVLLNDTCVIRKRNGVPVKYEGSCFYERYYNSYRGCNTWSCRKNRKNKQ